jgi:hypothetical protein
MNMKIQNNHHLLSTISSQFQNNHNKFCLPYNSFLSFHKHYWFLTFIISLCCFQYLSQTYQHFPILVEFFWDDENNKTRLSSYKIEKVSERLCSRLDLKFHWCKSDFWHVKFSCASSNCGTQNDRISAHKK